MRMIFLDAAGLSNPKHEPFVVIAGVIVHADKQWRALGEYLNAMADEYVPAAQRAGFAFHATELFSGGRVFSREKYDRDQRWKILDELLSIPEKFDLPIVWGYARRAAVLPARMASGQEIPAVLSAQVMAFSVAASIADRWMNSAADADEIAQMIMENDDQSRRLLALTQRVISDPKENQRLAPDLADFKLTRIMYPMHFELKSDSSALQVADVCAFAIKRWLMGKIDAQRFYRPLERYLVNRLRSPPDSTTSSAEEQS